MSQPAQSHPDDAPMPVWLEGRPGQWIVRLHVQPGARQTGLAGVHGESLKLKVAAPPVDGQANAAVLEWLSSRLGLPIRSLQLVSGASSRSKRIRIALDGSLRDLLTALTPADPA